MEVIEAVNNDAEKQLQEAERVPPINNQTGSPAIKRQPTTPQAMADGALMAAAVFFVALLVQIPVCGAYLVGKQIDGKPCT